MAPEEEAAEVSHPTKRIRWATHRATGTQAANKRLSLKERLHRRVGSNGEKKRDSLGKETAPSEIGENVDMAGSDVESDDQEAGRTIYVNIPLPAHEKDEDGHPLHHYARNKIRTAKYTPLSFIPKNLWWQFHNIANMYFLFIIILGVCPSRFSITPVR
jgi:phospholipid-translocating ATPase